MLVAVPAFAQDKPATSESQPAQTAPATTAQAPATDDAAPDAAKDQTAQPAAERAPAQETATATQAAPAQDTTTAAQPAQSAQAAPAAAPAATQDQVAQAVTRDWATFDKDGNSQLSAAEFGAWMSTLRKAAEPNFVAGSPEANTWESQAFTTADADKSASVTKQELTIFLTPKPA
ncbi:hypothetical protein [Sphingomonas sp.]|jgi:hypothetical protein|uniref:hypothetical protein n=1 Tax=Sphingomonas sp. TaxID=28214 RepID=UPI002EDB54A8